MRVNFFRYGQVSRNQKRLRATECSHRQYRPQSGIKNRDTLNRHKIDLIFLSSLKRSQATTELLVKEKKCSILHSKHFLERNFGLVEGLVFNEIYAKCNKKRKLLLRTRNPKYSPKGGESLKDVEKRVLMFFSRNKNTILYLLISRNKMIKLIFR